MTDNELIQQFMDWEVSENNSVSPQTSWDWLMPVVIKIESLAPNRVIIDCNECRIVSDKRFKVHTLKKINSVYQCVVQFIKWYNQQNQ